MGAIYKITNKINNKVYVGKRQTSKDKFFKSNYYGGGKLIKLAVKKYGIDNFIREIIDFSDDNQTLKDKEKYWIKFYNCKSPNGYNISDGGGDGSFNKGKKRTKEQRDNLSKAHLKNPYWKGKKLTKEHRKKLSLSHIGIQAGINHPMWGKHHTEESRKLISEKTIIAMARPEVFDRMSKSHKGKIPWIKGKHHREESKKQMSLSHLGKKDSEETRRKKSGKIPWNKGKKMSEEFCEKCRMGKRNKKKPK